MCTLLSIRCMGGHSKHKLQAILENLYRQSKKLGKSHLRNYKALGRFWAVPKQQQLYCNENLTIKWQKLYQYLTQFCTILPLSYHLHKQGQRRKICPFSWKTTCHIFLLAYNKYSLPQRGVHSITALQNLSDVFTHINETVMLEWEHYSKPK